MRKIIQYKMIKKEYESDMNTSINELILDGWEVYGFPAIASSQYTIKLI